MKETKNFKAKQQKRKAFRVMEITAFNVNNNNNNNNNNNIFIYTRFAINILKVLN